MNEDVFPIEHDDFLISDMLVNPAVYPYIGGA